MRKRKPLQNRLPLANDGEKEVEQLTLDFTKEQVRQAFVYEFVDDVFHQRGLKCCWSETLGLQLYHMDDIHGEAWKINPHKCRELCSKLYDHPRITKVYHDRGVEKLLSDSMENQDGLLLSQCAIYVCAHESVGGLTNISLMMRLHRDCYARIVPQNLREAIIEDAKKKNRLLVFPELKIDGLQGSTEEEFYQWFKNWPILESNIYRMDK